MIFDVEIKPENLIKEGYKKQKVGDGFVLIKKDGRFHAKIKYGKKGSYLDIHFDFFFNRYGHPSVFYTPNLLKEEINRIKQYATSK